MDVFWVRVLNVTYMSLLLCKFDRIGVLFVGVFDSFGPQILKCIGMYLNGDSVQQKEPR